MYSYNLHNPFVVSVFFSLTLRNPLSFVSVPPSSKSCRSSAPFGKRATTGCATGRCATQEIEPRLGCWNTALCVGLWTRVQQARADTRAAKLKLRSYRGESDGVVYRDRMIYSLLFSLYFFAFLSFRGFVSVFKNFVP